MSPWFVAPAALLVVAMVASAGRKAARATPSDDLRRRLRVLPALWTLIGLLEAAAAVGICVGFGIPTLGFAAAVGATLLMLGAVAAHLRVHIGGRALLPPAVLATCAVLTAIGFAGS